MISLTRRFFDEIFFADLTVADGVNLAVIGTNMQGVILNVRSFVTVDGCCSLKDIGVLAAAHDCPHPTSISLSSCFKIRDIATQLLLMAIFCWPLRAIVVMRTLFEMMGS